MFTFTPFIDRTQQLAATATARAMVLAHRARNYQPGRAEKMALAVALYAASVEQKLFAQDAVNSMNQVKTLTVNIVNVLFIIFLAIGVVRTVKKFLGADPDALESLGWLFGGVLLWFGFNIFKKDLAGKVNNGNSTTVGFD